MQDVAAIVFADTTFNVVDWTADYVTSKRGKGCNADVQNVKNHVDCINTGGNPGSFRQTVLQWEGSVSENGKKTFVSLTNFHHQAVYDPSYYGRISGIDFSFDLLHIAGSPDTTVKYSLLVRQDGILFVSPAASLSTNKSIWRGYTLSNLTADYFRRLSPAHPTHPNPHPDFSSRGSPLQFGYLVQASTSASELFSVTGVDNWKVLISSIRADQKRMQELEKLLMVERRERQILERELLEDKQHAEQEIRNLRLKAEEAWQLSRTTSTGSSTLAKQLQHTPVTNPEEKAKEYSGLLDNARAQMQRAEQERRAQKEAWEKAVAHLRAEQQGLMHQLDAERSAKERLEQKMTAQLEGIESVHVSERERLDQDLCKYRERISQLEKELRSECGARAKREEELKTLKDKAALADELKGSLCETQSMFEAKLKAHEEQLKRAEEEREKREMELEEDLREHADFVQKLQKELEHVKSAKRELELELQQKQHDWEADVQSWEEERETLREQLDAAHREREELVRDLTDKHRIQLALHRSLDEREQEHQSLAAQWREEADAQRDRLSQAHAELDDARQLFEEKESELALMKREMDELQQRLADAIAEIRANTEQRRSLEDEVVCLAEEKALLEKQLASERSNASEAASVLDKVQSLYTEEKLQKEQAAEQLSVAVESKAQAEQAWEAQRAELAQRISTLEKQLQQQQSVVQVLRDEALSRQRVEEELESERAARLKAEDTLAKLTEIFQGSLHAEEEWEFVPTDDAQ